jgi:hypothetical protein
MQFRTEKPEITAPGYTGMRKGIDRLANAGPGSVDG